MTDIVLRKVDKSLIGIGLVVGGFGLYLVLAGLGLAPQPSRAHAPGFVVACAGLAFFGGGSVVLMRGVLGMHDKEADLPAGTPRGAMALTFVCGNLVVASLALIGTWIAFGGGTRTFTGSGAFVSGSLGETIGRTVFGIGAIMTWLMLIAFVRVSIRKFRAQPS